MPGVKAALLPLVQASTTLTSLLQAIPEEIIFERAILGRLPAKTWRSAGGRAALLGDSAHGMHPNMGQGANSALGSAVSLVDSVASFLDNESCKEMRILDQSLVQGLERYETNRRPRMDWIQRVANMLGCSQASGQDYFDSQATSKKWYLWPHSQDDVPPPLEGHNVVQSFDPLTLPQVSLL